MTYADLHQQSLQDRDRFWREQAGRIDWQRRFDQVCDLSQPPFTRWFVGGRTNLCHNAVDRHVAARGDQAALVYVSSETGDEHTLTYAELHREVQRMAAMLQTLGIRQGDRVLIYMPMIPQAVVAMLATVRLGAIHSVVFGGFASVALAQRIDDATPKLIITADAAMRGGKVLALKPLVDQALRACTHAIDHVLVVDRHMAPTNLMPPRDVDHARLRSRQMMVDVPCVWVESNHPSYILYTSGTTGKPKGVQRDTGGYAVALAASMEHIYQGQAGEVFFCTGDIGWVVGHSYTVYAPLIAGMTTVLYEGLPIRPDAAVWWSVVEKYKVNVMFASPTAVRVLRKHDPACLKRHDLSSLRQLFLAGEPLDEPTSRWISSAIDKPVIDNYWQTETGWPILSLARGVEPDMPARPGSPGLPMLGYDVCLLDEQTGETLLEPGRKGLIAIRYPLPPGCMQTVWRDDERFEQTYWRGFPGQNIYSTFDWGVRDEDGYYTILGRTDDVINVAGHRLGSREIEEAIGSHPAVAEMAVVGVADAIRGQVPVAFVVLKNDGREGGGMPDAAECAVLHEELGKVVDQRLGAIARPYRIVFVPSLLKTRSGKLLRRIMQAVCEGRETGDLTTVEDPAALEGLRERWAAHQPPPV